MSGLISRQDAIDAMRQYSYYDNRNILVIDEEIAIIAINDLPSAQPERKTGRWIPQDRNYTHGNISTCIYFPPVCSECGHTGDFNMNFCPQCGLKMEVKHETD